MSALEYHVGKLIPIKTNNAEQTAKEILERDYPNYNREDIGFYYTSHINCLQDISNEYIYLNKILYKIKDNEFGENDDLSYIEKHSDGTVDYVVGFYNGGCCLSEALEYELNELKNNNNGN